MPVRVVLRRRVGEVRGPCCREADSQPHEAHTVVYQIQHRREMDESADGRGSVSGDFQIDLAEQLPRGPDRKAGRGCQGLLRRGPDLYELPILTPASGALPNKGTNHKRHKSKSQKSTKKIFLCLLWLPFVPFVVRSPFVPG